MSALTRFFHQEFEYLFRHDANSCNSGSLPEEFRRRIESCMGTRRSNCIGTALYVSGEIAEDSAMDTANVYDLYLKELRTLRKPVVGCLAAWHVSDLQNAPSEVDELGRRRMANIAVDTIHMGVITHVKPALITSRHGIEGEMWKDERLSCENKTYRGYYDRTQMMFYLPAALSGVVRT